MWIWWDYAYCSCCDRHYYVYPSVRHCPGCGCLFGQ